MANYENIKDYGFDKLTAKRQREIASMGGKASQAAKKQKKNLKEIFQMVGSMEVTDRNLKDKIEKMGVPSEDITWNVAVAISTYLNAVKKNDVKTIVLLLKMLDESNKGEKSKNEFEEFMREVE